MRGWSRRCGKGLGWGLRLLWWKTLAARAMRHDHLYVFEKVFPRLARVRKTDEVIEALS